MSKCDKELGERVHQALVAAGVEIPMAPQQAHSVIDAQVRKSTIEALLHQALEILGLDLTDDSLQETPRRVAKMWVDELYAGLDYNIFPKCTAIENKMQYDEMVVVTDIGVMSTCEHHLVIIDGHAAVAYIPAGKVIGLSKINRIVDFFAKRPQVQERLTEQVYHALREILGTDNIAVAIDAEHYCVKARGVRDVNSRTKTCKLGGRFKEDAAMRAEFMALAK